MKFITTDPVVAGGCHAIRLEQDAYVAQVGEASFADQPTLNAFLATKYSAPIANALQQNAASLLADNVETTAESTRRAQIASGMAQLDTIADGTGSMTAAELTAAVRLLAKGLRALAKFTLRNTWK